MDFDVKAIEGSEFSPSKLIITTALDYRSFAQRGGLPERAHILHKPFALSELESLILQ
jgi:hypothetical protein